MRPSGVRGEFRPIATSVPGIQLGEHFPLLARQADKLCILRSVTHGDAVHTSAAYTMLTGSYHPRPNLASAGDIPARPRTTTPTSARSSPSSGAGGTGSPPSSPCPSTSAKRTCSTCRARTRASWARPYDPLLVESDAPKRALEPLQIALPTGLTADRLADRRVLRDRLTRRLDLAEASGAAQGLDPFEQAGLRPARLAGGPAGLRARPRAGPCPRRLRPATSSARDACSPAGWSRPG